MTLPGERRIQSPRLASGSFVDAAPVAQSHDHSCVILYALVVKATGKRMSQCRIVKSHGCLCTTSLHYVPNVPGACVGCVGSLPCQLSKLISVPACGEHWCYHNTSLLSLLSTSKAVICEHQQHLQHQGCLHTWFALVSQPALLH